MNDYQNGYSVFDRLSVTETQSSAGKRHNSPKGKSAFPAFSGYAIRSSRSPSNASVAARSIQPSTSSSSHLVSPKIFDRLASTETYASAQMKGKIAAQPARSRSASAPRTTKTSSAFFARMAYTETFASAQMKGLIDTTSKKNDGRPSSRGRSSAGRSVRSEAKGTSFWDRMSKTETFASATMKGIYNSNQRTSTPTVSPKHYASGRSSPSARSTSSRTSRNGKEYTTSSFFDRLSKMETLSSLQKKKDLADAARSYHSSSPNSFSKKKPMFLGSRGASSGFGSSSTSSAPSTTKKYVSPSNRSVGSMRSATSARTTARSVATTKSATTARSIGTLGTSTVRSNISNKSSRSSNSSSNTLRTTHTAARKITPSASQRRGLPPSSSSVLSRLGFPPPSPKSRSPNTTSKRSIQTSRASSSSPQPIYSKTSPIPVSSTTNLHRPKPKPRPKPQPTRSKVSAPRSAPVPTPVPTPELPPQAPPRPVLKFDDDDELSFGSEDSDEASLGPASVKAPQDGGSVTSKSIASRKSAATTAASDSILGAAALGAAASLTIGTGVRRGEEEVSVHGDIDDHDTYMEKSFATAVEEGSGKAVEAHKEFIQETETDDFLDEFEDAFPAVSAEAEEEERSEHYEEEVDNSEGEEEVDDFLDDLDDENEPETHEEPEEEEVKEELAARVPLVPLVHESDDELSFGSDDGDDDWLGEGTNKEDNEAVNGEGKEEKDPMEEAVEAEQEPDVDDLDEVGGVIDSNSESSDTDPKENTANDDGEADIPMEDEHTIESEHSNESEVDVPMDDVESKHSDESMSEEEIPEDDGDEAPEEAESDSDHIDYDDEEYDEEPQIVEEEYDEQEDLDHMDSLDLVLDATNSNEAGHDHEVEVIDVEDEFDAGIVEHSVCKYKILKSEKYHPEYGLEEVHPDDLYLKETLQCFEDGDISNEEIAVLIIEALFEKDFENGDHWEIDAGTAREMEEDEGGGGDLEDRAFVVKRQARLDWNDLYSVAAAKGTIIIDPEKNEIRVENYSYFVAG